MARRPGFGVIGVGIFGSLHARVYAEHPEVDLVAVCDLDARRVRRVARKFGVRHAFTDYRELLALPQVSAVSISTPDFAHTEPALAAIRLRKHLLVEKPLTTSLVEAQRLARAARQAKVTAMVDFHNHFSPPMLKVKDALDRGLIGKPVMAYVRLSDVIAVPSKWFSWTARTTVAWFLGSHMVELLCWLLEDKVARVYSVSRSGVLKRMGVNTPDFFQTTLEFRGGATAVVETAWILPNSEPNIIDLKLEILGSKGSLRADPSHSRIVERYTQKEAVYPDLLVAPEFYGRQHGFAAESIRHFADCIVQGTRPIVGLQEGVENVRVLEAVHRSARTGKPVSLAGG